MIADASQLDIKLITVLPAPIQRVRNERRLPTEEEAAYVFGVSVTTMERRRRSGARNSLGFFSIKFISTVN
jgi:hypothetical protein